MKAILPFLEEYDKDFINFFLAAIRLGTD